MKSKNAADGRVPSGLHGESCCCSSLLVWRLLVCLGRGRQRNNISQECPYKALQRSRDYTVEARVTQGV